MTSRQNLHPPSSGSRPRYRWPPELPSGWPDGLIGLSPTNRGQHTCLLSVWRAPPVCDSRSCVAVWWRRHRRLRLGKAFGSAVCPVFDVVNICLLPLTCTPQRGGRFASATQRRGVHRGWFRALPATRKPSGTPPTSAGGLDLTPMAHSDSSPTSAHMRGHQPSILPNMGGWIPAFPNFTALQPGCNLTGEASSFLVGEGGDPEGVRHASTCYSDPARSRVACTRGCTCHCDGSVVVRGRSRRPHVQG